jgi:hypothetical protein
MRLARQDHQYLTHPQFDRSIGDTNNSRPALQKGVKIDFLVVRNRDSGRGTAIKLSDLDAQAS